MPLSADQQAMLQLLLERGQGYPELAVLLSVDEVEVRERARRALEELAGADPDRRAPLTDYVLGQSDPIDRADAVRHLRDDAEDHQLARELIAALRDLYPEAELPRLPGEPRPSRFTRRAKPAAAPGTAERPKRLGAGFSQRQTRLVVVLASAAVLLIAVVLGVTGAFGGDDEEAPGSSEPSATTTGEEPVEELAVIDLRPTSGGDARGQVTIGVASAGQPYADLSVEGLDPAAGDSAFILWLLLNKQTGYPVSAVGVPANGRLTDRYPIPSAVAAVAARTKFVDISLASRRSLQREILNAAEQGNPVVPYTGESVLRGTVSEAPAGAS